MSNTRAEHLQWCKDRALAYIEIGDVNQAFTSMVSDIGKHPETKDHMAIEVGMMLVMQGLLKDPRKMGEFIRGFN